MRLSEISGKEIIDFQRGERLGVLGQTDLVIDEENGQIEAFIIPTMRWFGFGKKEKEVTVYWDQIKKIGQDMIIIDLEHMESS
ncbi:YlmC/YmxH family sporulation protein [Halalkalibacterium halodurans]|uniref:BH2404 protein n=2 Tax=Halalkalibacterium halodurans TaxID=86665 RepID=Q9KA86_HALH5|nr:YlmC/YmxH family sporulation protein [Halalkalibacterium halodurans]MDY7222952.1 YlmC/YmxH family sporulation protein [Halalkalibacterium halodurans]MDY7242173.1 YlmC/YmxH family sporulation protein [Halalkalibacterium halodurans]MED3646219.1 YlmC/YmxH family sporulation protein [Halalkalibacterium halodurans]MED4080069.1 YlmC/YmxH family sporulation protein [Halalkalibacterium halodurans]MED4086836.1 YlmC/YmxH family sporulation protein [Halalkalibacterium halodurans]